MPKHKRIGEKLIEAGLIDERQLLRALERQRTWGGRIGSNLVMIGALTESELLRFLAAQTGVKELEISDVEIGPQILAKIPRKVVEQFHLIPVYMKDKRTLVVAMADPTDLNAVDQVRFITGLEVEPVITSYSSILQAIHKYYLGQDLRSSSNQEIVITEEATDVEEGFHTEDMEKHGGRPSSEDPDLIIFGGVGSSPARQPKPVESEPPPSGPPLPPDAVGDDELGRPLFDFEREQDQAEVMDAPPPSQPQSQSLEQFTDEQKLLGLYHVLLKKRLVSEAEIAQELMRLWSLGKLE